METGNDNFDPNTVAYLRQADATFRNGFEEEDMKEIFLNNVFEEIQGSEMKLSVMKSASFIMEQFIAVSSPRHILQLLKAYLPSFEEVSFSQQGCHVLQKTLQHFIHLLNSAESVKDDEVWPQLFDVVISCCEVLMGKDNLCSWMSQTYGTHIVRSLLETLGGVILSSKKQNTRDQSTLKDLVLQQSKLPSEFLEAFEELFRIFISLEKKKIVELLADPSGTPCVCVMVRVASLRSGSCLDKVCQKILSVCSGGNNSTLVILAKDRTGSHVLECLLESGHQDTCLKLHEIFFSNSADLIEHACHPVTNFVIQKMIVCSELNEKFEATLEIILSGLEDIFAERRYGIVQKLAEQCLRVQEYQSKLVKSLLQTFHCKESEKKIYFVPLVASSTTYEAFFPEEGEVAKVPPLTTVLYHGSLLLQTLLQFENTVVVAKSFTEMPAAHSVTLACDVSGSHLVDSFFSSNKVKTKRKRLWLEKVKDDLHAITCDKYGSRVMDNIWKCATLSMKVIIVESLANQEEVVSNNQYGRHVFRKFGVKQFTQRRSDWEDFQTRQAKKRKAFEEFMPSATAVTSKKQKNKVR